MSKDSLYTRVSGVNLQCQAKLQRVCFNERGLRWLVKRILVWRARVASQRFYIRFCARVTYLTAHTLGTEEKIARWRRKKQKAENCT